MINGYRFNNALMISSTELYSALHEDRKQYPRWIKRFVLENQSLDSPRDFVLIARYNTWKKLSRNYLLTTTLAKAILIEEGTILSKKLRLFIEDSIETGAVTPIHAKQMF